MSNERIMNLHNDTTEIFVPDSSPIDNALARTNIWQ